MVSLSPGSESLQVSRGITLSLFEPFVCQFHEHVYEENLFVQIYINLYIYIYIIRIYIYTVYNTVKQVVVFSKARSIVSVYD